MACTTITKLREVVDYCIMFETILVLRRCGLGDDLIHTILTKYTTLSKKRSYYKERQGLKERGQTVLDIWYVDVYNIKTKQSYWTTRTAFEKQGGVYTANAPWPELL
jgi:hypothetical protein